MLEFKPITIKEKNMLSAFYSACPYESCEYSSGIKLFWNRFYPYEYALSANGSLIVKYIESGNTVFEVPVLNPSKYNNINGSGLSEDGGVSPFSGETHIASLKADLDEIDEYCIENEIIPVFSDVPEELLSLFVTRYNFTKIENYREACDYIYRLGDLRDFKGRHYSGQRNHINKFKSLYPDYVYRQLKPGEDLSAFWEKYYGENVPDSKSALQEKEVAMAMVSAVRDCKLSEICQGDETPSEISDAGNFSVNSNCERPDTFVSGAIEINGAVAALCVGEILGSRLLVHIEKALREYEGIYPLMVSEFLKHISAVQSESSSDSCPGSGRETGNSIIYVNREDDSGDRGLRISKTQYRPCRMVSKYVILLQSELLYVDAVPEIKTGRLVLDELTASDAAVYQGLCLDDERNKYWGYDYRDDLEDEYKENLPGDYFLRVTQTDFEKRICLNLAVRLEGRIIGEVVLYAADFKGSIEIGCRLLKDFEGRGYGREAMLAAADWAVYKAGFRRVRAKCFRENAPSFKMLSSFMKKCGEDEAFCYFEKLC